MLHPCITRHWPQVRERCEEVDHPLPHFVDREFASYLRCGFLEHGFTRIHCPGCGHERLVAFSCKGRGFCPCYAEERKGRTVCRRWVPWATLLLRVFGVDVFACPKCEGRMQRIAFIIRPKRSGGRIGPNQRR